MELTRIQQSFKVAMNELNLINFRLGILSSSLFNANEKINENSDLSDVLMITGLGFEDICLSVKTDVHMRGDQFILNKENLNEEISIVLNREFLFHLSQAYEVLETYLYNQVAELIYLKGGLQLFIDNKSKANTFESIRKALKSLGDRQNNRHLLNILRANCELFALHESENIKSFDYRQWMEMVSEIRHSVVHQRTDITKDDLNKMPNYFNKYFKVKRKDDSYAIQVNYGNCLQIMGCYANYIFLIYKAVATKCYSDPIRLRDIDKILDYVKFIRINNDKVELL